MLFRSICGKQHIVCHRIRVEPHPGRKGGEASGVVLLWLDFNGLGLEQKDLMRMLVDDARIAANDGTMFGKQGKGFARLNVGTPRCVLTAALEHIREAVEKINAK